MSDKKAVGQKDNLDAPGVITRDRFLDDLQNLMGDHGVAHVVAHGVACAFEILAPQLCPWKLDDGAVHSKSSRPASHDLDDGEALGRIAYNAAVDRWSERNPAFTPSTWDQLDPDERDGYCEAALAAVRAVTAQPSSLSVTVLAAALAIAGEETDGDSDMDATVSSMAAEPESWEDQLTEARDVISLLNSYKPQAKVAPVKVVNDDGDIASKLNYEVLRLHLISAHCNAGASSIPGVDLRSEHEAEHKGPASLRNHDQNSLFWDPEKVRTVLGEAVIEDHPVMVQCDQLKRRVEELTKQVEGYKMEVVGWNTSFDGLSAALNDTRRAILPECDLTSPTVHQSVITEIRRLRLSPAESTLLDLLRRAELAFSSLQWTKAKADPLGNLHCAWCGSAQERPHDPRCGLTTLRLDIEKALGTNA